MPARSIPSMLLIASCAMLDSANAWMPSATTLAAQRSASRSSATCAGSMATTTTLRLSDWSNFDYLEDEDDLESIDSTDYAKEEDTQEDKARVGASLEPPEIINDAEAIWVPAGSQLPLDEDTVKGVLSACREEIGTLFGYTAENRGVGITGGVDFVEMDGPIVILRLKGRFWHQRETVLDRVTSYLVQRIPEIIDVDIEDAWQLTDEANNVA
eukprot:CAMPEP_0198133966 /NCGR_PEP_ID=MMETSP1442-20131203/59838_1 /TAXON_ID= /ORGANISM="Craspedostauros australis, Strain CCMP3328" /LENGTH=212 /DNA_ID=CAMNT_0043795101 /DNA_START=42 /DNA_END=680 /DNA_ORIENTATION=+